MSSLLPFAYFVVLSVLFYLFVRWNRMRQYEKQSIITICLHECNQMGILESIMRDGYIMN